MAMHDVRKYEIYFECSPGYPTSERNILVNTRKSFIFPKYFENKQQKRLISSYISKHSGIHKL